ncbi:MAG: Tat pathway signal protein [Candidatus Eisenbacteria bacterium]|nr:Tat pathway signal protein [Candidatus Eisenbacteria bacterium]
MHRHTTWILLIALCATCCAGVPGAAAQGTDALLDTVQHAAFNYFWYEANPANGMVKDRSTAGSPASIAAVGFGLSSICIGVDHGWVTRSQASDRVLATLTTFWTGPQGSAASGTIGYKGLYYHFLDMGTARRTWSCELSTIDTALLFAGILDARQYFTGSDPREIQIRALADSIYYRADWNFMRNLNPGILMGWKPGTGFSGFGQWTGYNEAMILYILAIGSPTHPVPATAAWNTWTSAYSWQTHYGYSFLNFPPLFGHQYSHCWVDFRNIRDAYMAGKGITYFVNSQRATRAQRAYCIANPSHWVGYNDSTWGLTASDDPLVGYVAHGAPPAQSDNNTLTPTAATSSIAFTPDICIPAIRNMYNNIPLLWGAYGFRDAWNPARSWYDTDFLGIDQGPIVMMIENYRTNSVWSRFMQNADIQRGLQLAGFTSPVAVHLDLTKTDGNVFVSGDIKTGISVPCSRCLMDEVQDPGEHAASLDARGLASGVYQYRLESGGATLSKKCILLQ